MVSSPHYSLRVCGGGEGRKTEQRERGVIEGKGKSGEGTHAHLRWGAWCTVGLLAVMEAPWFSSSFTHCGLSYTTAECSGVLPSPSVQFSV